MALSTRQVVILLACFLSLALADTQDFRRLGRQVQDRPQQQPQRRLRPVPKRRLPGPPPVPAAGSASASEPRFSNFEADYDGNFGRRPSFRPDGVEYDDNGNRKQYKTNGNIPRGYDRYSQEASQPRARPAYPVPKRTIDERRKAVIDEIDPSVLEELQAMPRQPAAQPRQGVEVEEDIYVPASGPAFASPSNLAPTYAMARNDLAAGALEASVIAGANAYGAGAGSSPKAVYQNEDRLFFQIHGQEGPHSYRYGYDTGNGFNRQFRYEERTAEGYVKGRYGFYDKTGQLQVINYTADPVHGFHAEGAGVPKYPH